jgi:hypothetical protein
VVIRVTGAGGVKKTDFASCHRRNIPDRAKKEKLDAFKSYSKAGFKKAGTGSINTQPP